MFPNIQVNDRPICEFKDQNKKISFEKYKEKATF